MSELLLNKRTLSDSIEITCEPLGFDGAGPIQISLDTRMAGDRRFSSILLDDQAIDWLIVELQEAKRKRPIWDEILLLEEKISDGGDGTKSDLLVNRVRYLRETLNGGAK